MLRPIYGRNNRPSRSTIERLVAKFELTGTEQNVPVPVRQRSARSVENIAAAEASVEPKPKCFSHTAFSSGGHLYGVVVANFAK